MNKEQWLQEHDVRVEQKNVGPCAEDAALKWVASSFVEAHKGKGYSSKAHTFSTGDTEENAIIRLAEMNGWPLWNM